MVKRIEDGEESLDRGVLHKLYLMPSKLIKKYSTLSTTSRAAMVQSTETAIRWDYVSRRLVE